MHTGVICPRGVNIGNRPLIEAKMKGCQVREWIVGEKHMSFSRILYMICVNGGYLVSEIFNNIDRKTWREIKETLQWPPMENQLVVYTKLALFDNLIRASHFMKCESPNIIILFNNISADRDISISISLKR